LLATKVEAFKGRGKNDYRLSHDIEDIITLIDGRASIALDLLTVKNDVLEYLRHEFGLMVQDKNFLDSLEGHISDRRNIVGRAQIILKRIDDFLALGKSKK